MEKYLYCKYATPSDNDKFTCPYRFNALGKPCPKDAGVRNKKGKLAKIRKSNTCNDKYCRLHEERIINN